MALDLKDRKILAELEMNAKISISELSKQVGLSKQSTSYRISKLEKENIIQGYNALIGISKLGRTIYVVYIKLTNISSSNEKNWVNQIEKDKEVLAVGRNAGEWDITLVIGCENNQALDKILKRVIADKSDKIKEKLITSEIESTYFNTDIIHKGKDREMKISDNTDKIKIDSKDNQIINLLSENARSSLLDISGKVDMSPNGVKHKIKSLENNKVIIGYKTKINYELLGFLHFRVFLKLKKFDQEIYKQISTFLKSKGSIESISRYMGYADVDFRCHVKTLIELYDLISDIKDKFLNNIIEVNSIPIF